MIFQIQQYLSFDTGHLNPAWIFPNLTLYVLIKTWEFTVITLNIDCMAQTVSRLHWSTKKIGLPLRTSDQPFINFFTLILEFYFNQNQAGMPGF